MAIKTPSTGKEVINLKTGVAEATQIATNMILTTEALAEALSVSERTVYNLRQSGEIPFVKVGKIVRFIYGDVVESLRERGAA